MILAKEWKVPTWIILGLFYVFGLGYSFTCTMTGVNPRNLAGSC